MWNKKRLTFQLARNTFVATMTIENGVPIEIINAMLGRKNVAAIQTFLQPSNEKITKDMNALAYRLKAIDEVYTINEVNYKTS